ncbi:hypothetical protein EJ04DRAFT_545910 [Polyplosphaeria fusca]|uniref:Nudix hydrolase domain-containing protein n=1 Tax=Polyplosphaeria fusca TaxID=682080 RepID=A0A9P4QPL7_9PLEO|nr:hypothetical protein EJ04DRAFT_545910 [Polyplosphaeria fusca]
MLSQSSAQALARLRAYTPPPTNWFNCPLTRRAAVLILLFPDRHGELKVVLTMRASTLRSYAGQAALPGGKADTLSEKPFDTARREADEEIGLPATDTRLPAGFAVEHLCEMPANLAKTELGVRPCVAFLRPAAKDEESNPSAAAAVEDRMIPRLDPKEVAAVFTAPFRQFLRKEWTSSTTTTGGASGEGGPKSKDGTPHSWYRGTWTDWHESRWRMHNFYVPRSEHEMRGRRNGEGEGEGEVDDMPTFRVFGMTARILVDAARVAYGEEPEFDHNSHFGDEDMIGRLVRMGKMGEVRRAGDELTKEDLREASKI